jgi:hypothetical protein
MAFCGDLGSALNVPEHTCNGTEIKFHVFISKEISVIQKMMGTRKSFSKD